MQFFLFFYIFCHTIYNFYSLTTQEFSRYTVWITWHYTDNLNIVKVNRNEIRLSINNDLWTYRCNELTVWVSGRSDRNTIISLYYSSSLNTSPHCFSLDVQIVGCCEVSCLSLWFGSKRKLISCKPLSNFMGNCGNYTFRIFIEYIILYL